MWAVSSQIRSSPAIAQFAVPPTASSTIRHPHDHSVRRPPIPGDRLQLIVAGLAEGHRSGTGRYEAPASRPRIRTQPGCMLQWSGRTGRHDAHMAKRPESTKTSLRKRLAARARERWPRLTAGALQPEIGSFFADGPGQIPAGCRPVKLSAPHVTRGGVFCEDASLEYLTQGNAVAERLDDAPFVRI